MPLIHRIETERWTLLVWLITESEQCLQELVTEGDKRDAGEFQSPSRRIERMAWRATLRTIEPDTEVLYTPGGAPYIEGSRRKFLGVSHTKGLAAVIISDGNCAVDIERADRELSRVRERFVSPVEEALADAAREDFAITVWCAKEVLYKYSGQSGLDFISDIRIEDSAIGDGTITGAVRGGEPVSMTILRIEGYIIVFAA